MQTVGTIKQIWRYPVKGMAGEALKQGELTERGVTGDRVWALYDTARQEIQSCKTRPDLLRCVAEQVVNEDVANGASGVAVTLPDGRVMSSGDAGIHEVLTDLTGHASTLERLRPELPESFYRRHHGGKLGWRAELEATFEREADEPLPDFFDDFPEAAVTYIAAPGSFFLVAPLHIVTTATLKYLQTIQPEADWDVRRFRPNLVIETEPGLEGLVEQAWVEKRLQIGSITMDCPMTTPRCGAVTRQQSGLDFDASMLRTIVRDADQNLGIYGQVTETDVVRVGDEVRVSI